MVGAGTFLESVKKCLQNSLVQGSVLAVLLHAGLLATKFGGVDNDQDRPERLTVSLEVEKLEMVHHETGVIERNTKSDKTTSDETIDLAPLIAPLIASTENPKPGLKPRPRISINNERFNQFLESETNQHITTKQTKLSDFSASFKLYFDPPAPTLETSYRDFEGMLGGGQYKVHKNGKTRCVLKMVPLSFDDHVYGAGGGTKDCTPEKKLDIKLRKSTRN